MVKLKCASFFAGVGGIDIGFSSTDKFEIIYANEFDKYPIMTYELNSDIKVDNRSICDVKSDEIPDFDVMLAGFPCTDISIAGNRKGLFNEDGTYTRSGLFFELIRIIKDKKPQIIFLENVKNLVTHGSGKTLEIVLESLKGLGYYCDYKVLNASEYGNVPQNRERIYIVAFNNKKSLERFTFPEPIELTKTIKDVIDFNSKENDKYYYTKGKFKNDIFEKLEEVIDDDSVYQWRRQYVRKNKSKLIPTLTANQGEGGHNVCIIKTKYGIRKMTPRECFNAQGFNKDFKLPDKMSDSRLYKQSGNSVCVPVIKRIADEIIKVIDNH